jgi:hypothetical protein
VLVSHQGSTRTAGLAERETEVNFAPIHEKIIKRGIVRISIVRPKVKEKAYDIPKSQSG